MSTYAIRSTLIGTLGVALALASASVLAISYRLTDLGTLGGGFSTGAAINASGQVTGFSNTADGSTHHFLWDGTRMQDLGTLAGRFGLDGAARVLRALTDEIDALAIEAGHQRGMRSKQTR